MAFRLAIIALENKSFEMPIVDLFTTMTSLAYLDSSSADNCRFCFQSGNAWSVIARGGLQQSEKLIISYQIPLSLSTTNLLGSNDSAQLSTEILYACARCSARQQK